MCWASARVFQSLGSPPWEIGVSRLAPKEFWAASAVPGCGGVEQLDGGDRGEELRDTGDGGLGGRGKAAGLAIRGGDRLAACERGRGRGSAADPTRVAD